MGVYGPANGGADTKNAEFYEEEVFEVLDTETYDNVIMAGDWNVFLNPNLDQKHYRNPEKYRSKTREAIKSKMRTHSLSDVYREQNPTTSEYTFKDRAGSNTHSRLDYFLVDQETASYTTKTSIEPITYPFDHSEITITVDYDTVMRGPGFWKFNNSHLESNIFKEMIRKELMDIVYEHQTAGGNHREAIDLMIMSPKELQEIKLNLNPHELMEQVHYILKTKIIKYFIATQRKRKDLKRQTELEITGINERLNSDTLSQDERNEEKKKTPSKRVNAGKNGRRPSKGNFSQIKTGMGYKCRKARENNT